jgi:hypothetical protein
MLAGVDVVHTRADSIDSHNEKIQQKGIRTQDSRISYREVAAPLRSGVLDLRRELSKADESVDVLKTLLSFIRRYKLFFVSITILIGIFSTVVLYIKSSTNENQNYEVIIDNEGSSTTIDSSEFRGD